MKRRTIGLLDHEAALVSLYATPGSEPHAALDDLVPEVAVHSESSAIRALVLAGHRTVEEERLRRAYDRAVAAGEVDEEALAWNAAARGVAAVLWAQE
jgi:hypothetical protein